MVQAIEAMEALVYDAADLRRVLGVGRPLAYRLLKKLGRRLGKRFVVSRIVLEKWLARGNGVARPAKRLRTRSAAAA